MAIEKAWYEALYADFDTYDEEPYTQNTRAEVDFLEEVSGVTHDARILDVGCGTGRHSLELARRGYRRVTGVDLAATMLQQAQAKAAAEGLAVTFLRKDARRLGFEEAFDVVVMLCEGGFSLMETDETDRQILQSGARALRAGGMLIMTAPNAAFMLAQAENSGFDALTLREQFTLAKDGQQLACTQRYYTFPELKWLLEAEGLGQVQPFAVGGGGYRRDKLPGKEDYELGVTAVKD